MIIKNPTNSELHVQIKGVRYVCPANGEVSGIPMEHARYWKTMLHAFIVVEPEGEITVVPEAKPEEVVAEVVPIQEVVEEKLTEVVEPEVVSEMPKAKAGRPRKKK